jgi:hypothetical protein
MADLPTALVAWRLWRNPRSGQASTNQECVAPQGSQPRQILENRKPFRAFIFIGHNTPSADWLIAIL